MLGAIGGLCTTTHSPLDLQKWVHHLSPSTSVTRTPSIYSMVRTRADVSSGYTVGTCTRAAMLPPLAARLAAQRAALLASCRKSSSRGKFSFRTGDT